MNVIRVLCLDVGEKKIGVAVSDSLGFTAQGLGVINKKNRKDTLFQIGIYLEKYNVEEILLGLPLNMNGTSGPKVEEVISFKKVLENKFDLPVKTWDERLTTVTAHKALLEADVSRSKRKKVVDKLAAVLILEGYLQASKEKADDDNNT